jgi:hypothetical protein
LQGARAAGYGVIGADIVDRRSDPNAFADFPFVVCNFLKHSPIRSTWSIVTNPPFDLIQPFCLHALDIAIHKVAVLTPLCRIVAAHWLQNLPLETVWLLTPRPSMPPGEYIAAGNTPGGGRPDHCWLIFNKQCPTSAQPKLRWLHRNGRPNESSESNSRMHATEFPRFKSGHRRPDVFRQTPDALKGAQIMTNDITKTPETDGLDTTDDYELRRQRVIQGMRLAFTNDYIWVDNNEEEFPPDRQLLLMRHRRVLQKWGLDNKPIAEENRFLEEGEKWPDVEAMNEAAPQSEWREGPTGLQGPWQCQHLFYFLDPNTFERFTYPTNTVGGHIAVGELKAAIKDARLVYGPRVNPIVTLSDTFMKTKYSASGRQRPHFVVVRWVAMGRVEPPKALLAETKALPAPTQVQPEPTQPELQLTAVQEPSLREDNDDIPDLGPHSENKKTKAPPARPTARREIKKAPAKTAARSASRKRLSNLEAG